MDGENGHSSEAMGAKPPGLHFFLHALGQIKSKTKKNKKRNEGTNKEIAKLKRTDVMKNSNVIFVVCFRLLSPASGFSGTSALQSSCECSGQARAIHGAQGCSASAGHRAQRGANCSVERATCSQRSPERSARGGGWGRYIGGGSSGRLRPSGQEGDGGSGVF